MLPKQYYTGGIGGVGTDKPHRRTGWFGINQGKIYQDNPGVVVYDDPSRNKAPTATTAEPVEKEAKTNTGANRGAAGRGSRRNMGVASNAFSGNIGSVNTEVQNDDVLLPYQKVNF